MTDINKLFESQFGVDDTPNTDPVISKHAIEDMIETRAAAMMIDLERVLHLIGAGVKLTPQTESRIRHIADEIAHIATELESLEGTISHEDIVNQPYDIFDEDDHK